MFAAVFVPACVFDLLEFDLPSRMDVLKKCFNISVFIKKQNLKCSDRKRVIRSPADIKAPSLIIIIYSLL